jgi:hypothetical protein
MDILYYSNFCKHSQKVLQTLAKTSVVDKISFICIDKRVRDPKNNQIYIQLENGGKVVLPPNIHSVPALLLVKKNYQVIYGGDEIVQQYQQHITSMTNKATAQQGEPTGYILNSSNNCNIVSEQFTFYNMSPDELSCKGTGGMRQMYNYVSAKDDTFAINTPPDTYRPNKLSNSITIDTLQKQRTEEMGQLNQQPRII